MKIAHVGLLMRVNHRSVQQILMTRVQRVAIAAVICALIISVMVFASFVRISPGSEL